MVNAIDNTACRSIFLQVVFPANINKTVSSYHPAKVDFIPKSERRYAFDVRYHDNVIEKAHVICNGALFLAFAEIKDEISDTYFGQEIREFLARRLVSNRWEALTVPPCPLHPEILVIASSNSEGLGIRAGEENDIAVLIPFLKQKT